MTNKVFIWEEIRTWGKIVSQNLDIRNEFSYIRVYHACRPIDLGDYYNNGLRLLNLEQLKSIAESIFCSRFTNITTKDISDAFEYIGGKTRQGFLYFALDKRELLTYSGHYLIYGSEFLHGVAVFLRGKYGCDYSFLLKESGIPTIFICDIPFEFLSESTIDELNRTIQRLIGKKSVKSAPHIDFSLILSKPIDANSIIGHLHPIKILDPIKNNQIYITNQLKCPWCK